MIMTTTITVFVNASQHIFINNRHKRKRCSSFQPVFHDCSMYYSVYRILHTQDLLLLISNPCSGILPHYPSGSMPNISDTI